ncbi:MAG: hypothetical protein F6K18_03840 [Okeania sp. SIO2C2]|uniref:hypothetical protein n=1 Tax=Okeania sp. SIO2C2 TaxID=2607787 RepID=UPI0013BAF372|nr:hypothetical protein [Okeania sp. SIO2C2]NEP86018.1 hypothetical protein [Okeania sp. SIO2C2]
MRREFFSGALENENIGDFSLGRDGWENFENNKHIFTGAPQNEKKSAIAPGEDSGKSFGTTNFSGASQDENIGNFLLGRDGWENVENNKHIFIGASQNEKYSAIASGEDSSKSFDRANFSGAPQDENVSNFPLGRDG